MINLIGSMESPYTYRKTWEYQDMPGHYLGEYSFYGESGFPTGWVDESDVACWAEVVAEFDGHKDVLIIIDFNGLGWVRVKQVFVDQSTGIVDFYYNNTNGDLNDIVLRRDEVDVMKITSGVGLWLSPFFSAGFQPNRTYYIRIIFTETTWELWIDEVLRWSGAHSAGSVNNIQFRTWAAGAPRNPIFYIDALDYSWADGWYLDRNKDIQQEKVVIYESEYLKQLEGILK